MKILTISILAALTLGACSGSSGLDNYVTEPVTVTLPDGRVVTCVLTDGHQSGGIDCLDATLTPR